MRVIKLLPLLLLFISACSKSSSPGSNEVSGQSASSNKGNQSITPLFEEAKKYVEFACVVNNCAGTACEGSKGTCKSKACTALPDGCSGIALTSTEIEVIAAKHAQEMVAEGYIDAKDFNISKSLVIQILKKK